MRNVKAAIDHFVNSGEHGEAWRKVLIFAPPRARARIGVSMYYSFYKNIMLHEEREEYRQGREWIEKTLDVKDLKYLIAVMPQKQKCYFLGLIAGKEGGTTTARNN